MAKAPLTITGQDLTLPVGTSIPDLNYTATGWKHNDASLGVAANPAAFSNLALWLDAADSSTLFSITLLIHQQQPILEVGKTRVETIIMRPRQHHQESRLTQYPIHY